MGTSLTGVKIKDSYDSLLKVTDNGPLDGTLQVITDGLGNNSALSLSTAGASVGGTLAVSGNTALTGNVEIGGTLANTKFYVTNAYTQLILGFNNSSLNFYDGDTQVFRKINGTETMRVSASGDISFRDSSANEAFYWDASAASLGIGTTNPDIFGRFYTRSVGITSSGVSKIQINGTSYSGIDFGVNGTRNGEINNSSSLEISTLDARAITLATNGTERMRIDSSGNVGIGVTPTSLLSVGKTTGAEISITTNQQSGSNASPVYTDLKFKGYLNGDKAMIRSWDASGNTTGGQLTFSTNSDLNVLTERMRITSGGYLKASNTGSYAGGASGYHELVSNADDITLYMLNLNLAAKGLLINLNNDGTTHYFFRGYSNSAGADKILIYTNGNVVNANNSYGAISDAKLKENVVDASPKLEDLMQVQVRNFNYIGDDKKQLGVVAQELEEVFPSMIDESPDFEERDVEVRDEEGNIVYKTEQILVSEAVLDEEGNVIEEAVYETIVTDEPEMTKERVDLGTVTKSVKYSVFVPMLIKAMQEQQVMINELRDELNALKQA